MFASQSRASQGRLKSRKIESGLYTKFRDHGFLLTLERACEAQIWKGILRFRGVKSSNFFWPAGAAPQGRRGRGASRPARPRVAYFPASTSFCYRSWEPDPERRPPSASSSVRCVKVMENMYTLDILKEPPPTGPSAAMRPRNQRWRRATALHPRGAMSDRHGHGRARGRPGTPADGGPI